MGDDNVGARLRHLHRIIGRKHVRCREQIEFVSDADQVDFVFEPHPGLFQILPEDTVDEADGREILDSRESEPG